MAKDLEAARASVDELVNQIKHQLGGGLNQAYGEVGVAIVVMVPALNAAFVTTGGEIDLVRDGLKHALTQVSQIDPVERALGGVVHKRVEIDPPERDRERN